MPRSQTLDPVPEVVSQEQRRRSSSLKSSTSGKTRPRRKSSGLGADIRGDTGAPAISTLDTTHGSSHTPPLSPRSSSTAVPRRSKRRKVSSFFKKWKRLSFTHTWINPLILICVVLALYAINPTPSNPIHKALFLSYELPPNHELIPAWARGSPETPVYYGKGKADFAFVAFYIVVLSFTREFLMQRVIRPTAIKCGIKTRNKQSRFMEQVYTAIYFSVFGPFGLYVMSRTPVWYFNMTGMYGDFPHRAHDGLFKAYYLLQASYWAQQAIVLLLQLEKPRQDFNELVAHHIVTLSMILLSYRFHFTYMGLAVYITHDISDFFLATAKTLNYLDNPFSTYYFALFACIWIYLRHYINLRILYSVTSEFATVGSFTLNWATQQYKCRLSQYISFALLGSLQSLNLFWLFYILRIAYRAALTSVAQDVRSEDEEEEEEEERERGEEERREQELKELKNNLNGKAKASGVDPTAGLQDVPEVRLNGQAVQGREESYAEAVKDNNPRGPTESYVEAKKENLKSR